MFGFSLAKLLFTVVAVAAVWYGFKALSRGRSGGGSGAIDRGARPAPADRPIEAEEMAACPVCGTYVSQGRAKACDRDDCPYPA